MRDFQTVLVGLMFLMPDSGADKRTRQEKEDGQEYQQGRKRGPIVNTANLPDLTPAGEHPADTAITEIEKYKEQRGSESQQLGNMPQDVVAHFMARDENNLRRVHLGDGGVPHHDALGSAKPCYVCVQRRRFFSRAHPVHSLRWNVLSRALHQLLERGGKRRILLCKCFELVEQRVNDDWLHENQKQADGQGSEPEVEPPAASALADDRVKDPDEEAGNNHRDDFAFGPIPQPRGPRLDGDSVAPGEPVLVNVRWQLEEIDGQNQQWRKDERLDETIGGDALCQGAVFRRELPAEDEPKGDQAIEKADQSETEVDAAKIMRFLVAFRRKRIGGDPLRRRLLERARWSGCRGSAGGGLSLLRIRSLGGR